MGQPVMFESWICWPHDACSQVFVADSLAQIPRGELPLRMMSFTETSQLLQKELMNDYSYRVTRHAR